MGYHVKAIPRGKYGEFSKIEEEFLEAKDALEQGNKIMALLELSDLVGAIEAYAKKFNMSLDEVLKMKNATQKAFEDGTRTPKT